MCSADDDEAMRSYRRALENSMSGASAAHPYELIGEEKMSLAKVRISCPCLRACNKACRQRQLQAVSRNQQLKKGSGNSDQS